MLDFDRVTELAALGIYLVVLIWIGVKSSGKIRNTLDYTVSGRDVAWIVVLATTAATMVGGGASIGSVANVYNYGIALALLSTAWYLQLIFTGIWLAPRLRRLDLLTVAQFFGLRFGEAPRRMAVVSCMVFLIGALVAQMVAMGKITETVLGLDYRLAVLAGASIVIFYSTVGGIRAVVKTDVLQFVVLVIGIGAASFFLLQRNGGFTGIMAVTGDQPFQLTSAEWPATRLITTFFVFFLGEMLVPPYAVRCFIARNAQSAQWGVAGSGLFLLCFMPICIFVLGASANVDPKIKQAIDEQRVEAGLDEADSQMVFPTLMRETFPAAFAGILIAALIAAVMSSGDSCLSCISTSVMEDIYRSMIDPEASDKKLLNVARIATVASGVLAAALSCLYSDIISILEFVYDFWAPTMVIPFLVGLFMYRKRWSLAITLAMAAGFIAVVVWRFLLGTPWKFSPGLFGFLVSLAVFILAIVLIELRQDPANPVATEKEIS